MDSPTFSLADLLACAEREVDMRRRVYPYRVQHNKMTQDEAARETDLMLAIVTQLRKLAMAGPLFREVWAQLDALPANVVPLLEAGPSPRDVFSAEPEQCRPQAVQMAAAWLRLAVKLPAPTPPAAPAPAPAEQPRPASTPQYCSPAQKEEIIRLLNHPAIERKEKTFILININRLTPEKATAKIAELQKKIDDADGPGEVEGLQRVLRRFVQEHGEALAMPECERLLTLCETTDVTASELRDNLAAAQQEVGLVHTAA